MYTKIANLYNRSLTSLSLKDLPFVEEKNASLEEMMLALEQKGIKIPKGFAITVDTYRNYFEANNLTEKTLISSNTPPQKWLDLAVFLMTSGRERKNV